MSEVSRLRCKKQVPGFQSMSEGEEISFEGTTFKRDEAEDFFPVFGPYSALHEITHRLLSGNASGLIKEYFELVIDDPT